MLSRAKWGKKKLTFCKPRSFLANINQSNKDLVRASSVLSEMIAKSSILFLEDMFIKESNLRV